MFFRKFITLLFSISLTLSGGVCFATTAFYKSKTSVQLRVKGSGSEITLVDNTYSDKGYLEKSKTVDTSTAKILEYDDAGRVTRAEDGEDQVVNFGYDTGGRLTSVDYAGESDSDLSYRYDDYTGGSSSNSVGRLTEVSNSNTRFVYRYNS